MDAKKIPSAQEIEKKLKLFIGLFFAAFKIKKHQLEKKHPEKTEKELCYMTMKLWLRGKMRPKSKNCFPLMSFISRS